MDKKALLTYFDRQLESAAVLTEEHLSRNPDATSYLGKPYSVGDRLLLFWVHTEEGSSLCAIKSTEVDELVAGHEFIEMRFDGRPIFRE